LFDLNDHPPADPGAVREHVERPSSADPGSAHVLAERSGNRFEGLVTQADYPFTRN